MSSESSPIHEIFEQQARFKSELRELHHDGIIVEYYDKILAYDVRMDSPSELLFIAQDIAKIESEMSPYYANPILHTIRDGELSRAANDLQDLEDLIQEKKEFIIEESDSIGDLLYNDYVAGNLFSHYNKETITSFASVLQTLGDIEGATRLRDILRDNASSLRQHTQSERKRKRLYTDLLYQLRGIEEELDNSGNLPPLERNNKYEHFVVDLQNIETQLRGIQYFSEADKAANIRTYIMGLSSEESITVRKEKNQKLIIGFAAATILVTAFFSPIIDTPLYKAYHFIRNKNPIKTVTRYSRYIESSHFYYTTSHLQDARSVLRENGFATNRENLYQFMTDNDFLWSQKIPPHTKLFLSNKLTHMEDQ